MSLRTTGVAPQHAGITGQVEYCPTVVLLAYVTAQAHALMDLVLYLPKVLTKLRCRPRRATAIVQAIPALHTVEARRHSG